MQIAPTVQKPPTKRRRRSRRVAVLCWTYLLILLGLIAFIRLGGDRNCQATLLLFAPRWVALLPLVVLVPLTLWMNRRMLIVLGVASLVAIFPLMGFCVGWHRFTTAATDAMPMRVVAFNVHHVDLRRSAARQFLVDTHPDVVALEETNLEITQGLFPANTWHVMAIGEELQLASRYPILNVRVFSGDFAAVCRLQTPAGPVDFVVVHLSSPHIALRDAVNGEDQGKAELLRNIKERTEQSALLSRLCSQTSVPLIIAGDFNLLFDSHLLRRQFPGMTDSFEAADFGFGWTYQNHWTAVRIDRVLSSESFDPRAFALGPPLGSPHLPIIADLRLKK